jgi:transcriptional regulator with XRE-family HTH domain
MATNRASRLLFDGAKLWAIREDDLRMSRAALADEFNITDTYLWKIERGHAQPSPAIRGVILDRLAELGCGTREQVAAVLTSTTGQAAA